MNSFRSAILSGKGLKSGNPVVHEKNAHGAETDNLGSVEIPRTEPRCHNNRDDDRHRLDNETATARFGGEEHQVDLINLSGGGAMIRADFEPRLWERVDLVFGEGAEIECAVRWLRGDRVGLEFAHETTIDCDPRTRDALLLDVIRRSFADVNFSAGSSRDAGVADRRAASDDEDAIANSRRTERRHPLVWMGQVLYNHDTERVRLRNISEHGALIESAANYALGAEIFLDLHAAGQHFATVSWACGDKFGLKFAKPFDMKLLGKAKPEVAPAMMIRPGPGGISADQDNPWAEGWQRQSIDDLRDDLEGFLKR